MKLLLNAIRADGGKRFLVDGFPRNTNNLSGWQQAADGLRVAGVLLYDCPQDVMEERLLDRGKTSGRTDDNVESIRKRFKTFHNETEPARTARPHRPLHAPPAPTAPRRAMSRADRRRRAHVQPRRARASPLRFAGAYDLYTPSLLYDLQVLKYYAHQGLVTTIDGTRPVEEVWEDSRAFVEQLEATLGGAEEVAPRAHRTRRLHRRPRCRSRPRARRRRRAIAAQAGDIRRAPTPPHPWLAAAQVHTLHIYQAESDELYVADVVARVATEARARWGEAVKVEGRALKVTRSLKPFDLDIRSFD